MRYIRPSFAQKDSLAQHSETIKIIILPLRKLQPLSMFVTHNKANPANTFFQGIRRDFRPIKNVSLLQQINCKDCRIIIKSVRACQNDSNNCSVRWKA